MMYINIFKNFIRMYPEHCLQFNDIKESDYTESIDENMCDNCKDEFSKCDFVRIYKKYKDKLNIVLYDLIEQILKDRNLALLNLRHYDSAIRSLCHHKLREEIKVKYFDKEVKNDPSR